MRQRRAFAIAVLTVCALAPGCDPPKDPVEVREVNFDALAAAMKDQTGKVVLVDFWATWCGPCVKRFPHLVELDKKYAAKGLVCMGLSMDDAKQKKEVGRFLATHDAAFANFLLVEGGKDEDRIVERFGYNNAIPFMALFDKSGAKVWDSGHKPLTDDGLDRLIETQLAK
jgi:thiol-disulfide isomerase/thioredoxin